MNQDRNSPVTQPSADPLSAASPLTSPPASLPAGEAPGALGLTGLEAVYDALAAGIDRAGSDHSEHFLVKLALLNAQALGDAALFRRQIEIALRDL